MIVKELFARLGLDVDDAGFSVAEAAMSKLRGGLLGVGAALGAVAVGLVGAAGFTAAAAGEIDDMAKRTGLAASTIQEMGYAADQTGTSLESIVSGLQFIGRNAVHAAEGSKEAQASFAKLGISVRGADGQIKSAETLLGEAADALEGVTNQTQKTTLAMAIFGKSAGPELMQFLGQGSSGIADLRREAHELGGVMGDDLVTAGDDFGDNLGKIKFAMLGLRNAVAGPLVKGLASIAISFAKWLKTSQAVDKVRKAVAWCADNIKLFATLLVATAIPALIANAGAIAFAASWYAALGIAAMVAAAKAVLAWAAVVLPIAALLLVIEDLYYLFTGGESAIGKLAEKWLGFLDVWSMGDADDNAFVKALKAIVGLIFDIGSPEKQKALGDALMAMFKPPLDWITEKVQALSKWIAEMLEPLTNAGKWLGGAIGGGLKGFSAGANNFGNYLGSALGNTPEARAPVSLPGFGVGGASMGSAAASSSSAGAPIVQAPVFSANFAIETKAGQSNTEIGSAVKTALEEWQTEKNREAFAAVNQ